MVHSAAGLLGSGEALQICIIMIITYILHILCVQLERERRCISKNVYVCVCVCAS